MKQVSIAPLATRLEECDVEHYPAWIIGLIWLAVVAFGVLFWAAAFLFACNLLELQ